MSRAAKRSSSAARATSANTSPRCRPTSTGATANGGASSSASRSRPPSPFLRKRDAGEDRKLDLLAPQRRIRVALGEPGRALRGGLEVAGEPGEGLPPLFFPGKRAAHRAPLRRGPAAGPVAAASAPEAKQRESRDAAL